MIKPHPPAKPYEEGLHLGLQDPLESVEYLNASLEDAIENDDIQLFLIALKDVAKAKGMTQVADLANLNRESLYKMLSSRGNPEFASLWNLLAALGLKFEIGVR